MGQLNKKLRGGGIRLCWSHGLAADGFPGYSRGDGGDFAMEQNSAAQIQPATRHALRVCFCQSIRAQEFDGLPGAPGGTPPNRGQNEMTPDLQ
ncbi:MAG: hypothetical protein JWR19_4237 [Pedosphaera sp.]|nr:hypothetical protein [Pedosphaera sp.]